jgi:hypothetical protein
MVPHVIGLQTSVATTLLGSDISIQSTPTRDPPPAFADASASTSQANGPCFGSLSSMMPATSAVAGMASVSTKSQESRFQKATAAAAVSSTSSYWIVKDSL